MEKVVDNLWLGDFEDAKTFDGERLCVLEGGINYPGMTYNVPILLPYISGVSAVFDDWHETSRMRAYASRRQLDLATLLIESRLAYRAKLLVHCAAGIERSPLTIAWWLVKTRRHSTLGAAYRHLQMLRPVIEDRQHWLEPPP